MTNDFKTWSEMTPEEKGALLLAQHEGKHIQRLCPQTGYWYTCNPSWAETGRYRVKPEPVVETVRLTGAKFNSTIWTFMEGPINADEYYIEFNTVDGEPDTTTIRMGKIKEGE